jgi:ClpP class serine protease
VEAIAADHQLISSGDDFMRRIIAAIVLATAFAVPARAMQFNQTPLGGNDFAITAIGEIVEGDTNRAAALIQNLAAATPTARIRALALDSPGGQVDEAEKLAALICRLRAGVMVLPVGREMAATA